MSDPEHLAVITAIESGIEYALMCLAEHDRSLGRTTLKNKKWAEQIEADIVQMSNAIKALSANSERRNESS